HHPRRARNARSGNEDRFDRHDDAGARRRMALRTRGIAGTAAAWKPWRSLRVGNGRFRPRHPDRFGACGIGNRGPAQRRHPRVLLPPAAAPPVSVRTVAGPGRERESVMTTPLTHAKVLITGATGFIGGRLAERLVVEHGAHVRALVRNY